jgi:hypothetical protein
MIIGFVGFIGSGKGTAGDILKDLGFIPISFAGLVKDVTAVMFDWPRHLLEGDTDESRLFRETPDAYWSSKQGYDFTPREALQKIETECGRDVFHKDFWILALEKQIDKNKNYVITDVRFPNEIEWIQKEEGFVIEIQRGDNPFWYDKLTDTLFDKSKTEYMSTFDVHYSEWAWVGEEIDAIILNNGTVEDLKNNIVVVLTNYLGKSIMNELLHNGEKDEII